MKKFIAYIVCILLVFGNVLQVFAYSDITENYSWAKEAIEALTEKNTVNGYPDGSFLPENYVSRAELTKMVCSLFGNGEDITYSDVKSDQWYYNFVSKSGGYFITDGNFNPDTYATREEVSYAVFSALKTGNTPMDRMISFRDQADIDVSYLEAVKALSKYGIITGYPDDTFRPTENITRAETAVALYRALQWKNTPPAEDVTPENKEETEEENNPEEKVESEKSDLPPYTYFFLVSKVSDVVDENGDIVKKVIGYANGKQEELLINDKVTMQYRNQSTNINIKAGDVIAFMRDYFGTIRTVNICINMKDLPRGAEIVQYKIGNTDKRQILYGRVEKIYKDKAIELTFQSTYYNDQNVYNLDTIPSVYLWKNNKATLSDFSEIMDSTYEPGDIVLAHCYDDAISEIIIIKE